MLIEKKIAVVYKFLQQLARYATCQNFCERLQNNKTIHIHILAGCSFPNNKNSKIHFRFVNKFNEKLQTI